MLLNLPALDTPGIIFIFFWGEVPAYRGLTYQDPKGRPLEHWIPKDFNYGTWGTKPFSTLNLNKNTDVTLEL